MGTALGTVRSGIRCAVAATALVIVTPACWGGLISPSGAVGFGDLGVTVAGTTSNINTATSFTFGNLMSTQTGSGYFAGLTNQFFGQETFTVSDPLSLQFGNAVFGSFASTKITQLSNTSGARSFAFEGLYTHGTFGTPFTPNPAPATFTLNLNQNGGPGTAISTNSTLEFAVQPVPEPTTLALLAMAAGTACVVRARRRMA